MLPRVGGASAVRGVPAGRIERLRRPRVAARLAHGLDGGALLITAPAGSGKTTALAEALELRGGAVAWVRCSEHDRDAGQLVARLVGAVQASVPGLADALGDRLATATERVDAKLALRALRSEIERLLVDPLALVLDDAEHLEGSVEATRAVSDLLATRAPGLSSKRARASSPA